MDTTLQTRLDALADRVITATGTIRQQLTDLLWCPSLSLMQNELLTKR